DLLEHLRLRLPEVRILNCELSLKYHRKEFLESAKHTRVRRSRGTAPNHLWTDGHVEADDAILIEANPVQAQRRSDDGPQRRKQERSTALSEFPTEFLPFVHLDRDMKWRDSFVGNTLREITNQISLAGVQLAHGTMT